MASQQQGDVEEQAQPPGGAKRGCVQSMQAAGKKLKLEVLAMYLALGDPECGWKARVMVVVVLCYALSPLDWIPELIPVLALLVDFMVLPLLVWCTVKLMPTQVLERARQRAGSHSLSVQRDWKLVGLVYALWLLNVVVIIRLIGKHTSPHTWFHTHQLKLMAVGALTVTLLFVLLSWWRLSVEQKDPHHTSSHPQQATASEERQPLLGQAEDEPGGPHAGFAG